MPKNTREIQVPEMHPLDNPRFELFCQYVVSGLAKHEAALEAGYKPKAAACRASMLLRRPDIKQRILELKKAIWSDIHMGIDERIARLSEIARAKLPDFITIDVDGSMSIDLNAANNAAISEVNIDEWQNIASQMTRSRTSKIKLINPIQAISELNKMEHIYEPDGSGNTTNIYVDKVLIDAKGRLERLLDSLAARSGEAEGSGDAE